MPGYNTGTPFPPSCALNRESLGRLPCENEDSSKPQNEAEAIQYIPGNPAIGLLPGEVHSHLTNEFATPLLDELYPRLWLVAKKSGRHIDALHVQRVKRRSIIATEDPRLHLVWSRDKIYVKPVPQFLLNHDFWALYLQPVKRVSSTENSSILPETTTASVFDSSIATGFMRSYASLIKYPLDFAIAKESYLIPTDINWIQWSTFISHFRDLEDDNVAKRYHYGQLRLSRLNWAVRILCPQHTITRWFYENSYWSTGDFMTRVTFPLIFLFAGVSLALSSMQVALAIPIEGLWPRNLDETELQDMNRAFWLFSIAVTFSCLVILVLLVGIPIAVLSLQLVWGFKNRKGKPATGPSTV